MTLNSESSSALSSSSQSSKLSVFVLRSGDPVDSGIVSDRIVRRITKDDFIILEGSVLSHPIAVKNSKSSQSSANSLLGL